MCVPLSGAAALNSASFLFTLTMLCPPSVSVNHRIVATAVTICLSLVPGMPLLPSTSRWPKHTHTCKAYLETPTHLATLIGCWLCVDGTVLKVVSIANYGHYHHCNISHICRSTSVPHTHTQFGVPSEHSSSSTQHTHQYSRLLFVFLLPFLTTAVQSKDRTAAAAQCWTYCINVPRCSRNGFFFSSPQPTSRVKYIFIFRPFQ